jgi:hypothetical protein
VNKIIAGTGITVTPNIGIGQVIISAGTPTSGVTSVNNQSGPTNAQTGAIVLQQTSVAVPGSAPTPLEVGNLGTGTFSFDISGGWTGQQNLVFGDGAGTPSAISFYYQQLPGALVQLGQYTTQGQITIGGANVSAITLQSGGPLTPIPPPRNAVGTGFWVGPFSYYLGNAGTFSPPITWYVGTAALKLVGGVSTLTFYPGTAQNFLAGMTYTFCRQALLTYSSDASQ